MKPKKKKALEKNIKFFSLAEIIRDMSADRSTKVGAIAVDKRNNVLCVGYNGFPRKVKDLENRHERPMKYEFTAHAEENLVAQAAFTGVKLHKATVLVTGLFPCTTCTRLLIQSGVKRIIYSKDKIDPKWEANSVNARQMFYEAGIKIICYNKETNTWKKEKYESY